MCFYSSSFRLDVSFGHVYMYMCACVSLSLSLSLTLTRCRSLYPLAVYLTGCVRVCNAAFRLANTLRFFLLTRGVRKLLAALALCNVHTRAQSEQPTVRKQAVLLVGRKCIYIQAHRHTCMETDRQMDGQRRTTRQHWYGQAGPSQLAGDQPAGRPTVRETYGRTYEPTDTHIHSTRWR